MLSEMEKSEIRAQYRDAKDQPKQIGILADLYDCPKSDILAVLGLPADTAASTRRSPRRYAQTVRDNVVRAVLEDGLSQKEAAARFGVPPGNVPRWVQAAMDAQGLAEAGEGQMTVDPAFEAAAREMDARAEAHLNRAFAERVMADLHAGIEGLHAFIDNFAGVDILSDDERDVMDRILYTASGFVVGVETGLGLAKEA